MQSNRRVRTYLDPDAVGPLPRSAMADDSDQLAAARTLLRVPGTSTVEISAEDVIEVVDPNRRIASVPPLECDTEAVVLPRRNLTPYVAAAVAGCLALLGLAAIEHVSSPASSARADVRPPPVPAPLPAAAVPVDPPPSGAAMTTGTLRVGPALERQRVFVDGVALTVPDAVLRCGPHDVATGSPAHPRTIDVPCGGEVTVFR
jgi:hypothetical protein